MNVVRLLRMAFIVGLLFGSQAAAQTSTDLNEGLRVNRDPVAAPGTHVVSWWGRSGVAYFIQTSLDLRSWSYVPLIEGGADGVLSWGFLATSDSLFIRLLCLPGYNPAAATTTDSDGDGVSDWDELNLGSDPFNALGPDGQPEWWGQHSIPPLHLPDQTPPVSDAIDTSPVADVYPVPLTPYPVAPETQPAAASPVQLFVETRRRSFYFTGFELQDPDGYTSFGLWATSPSYSADVPTEGTTESHEFDRGFAFDMLNSLPFGPTPEEGWSGAEQPAHSTLTSAANWIFLLADDPENPSIRDYQVATADSYEVRLWADGPAPEGGLRQRFLVITIEKDHSSLQTVSATCEGAVTLVIPEGEEHSRAEHDVVGQVVTTGGGDYRAIRLQAPRFVEGRTVEQVLIPFSTSLLPSADDATLETLVPVDSTSVAVAFSLWSKDTLATTSTSTNLFTGGEVAFSLDGPGQLAAETALLSQEGIATTTLTPPAAPGSTAKFTAKIKTLRIERLAQETDIDCHSLNLEFESDPIRYIHGAPEVELSPTSGNTQADATGTLTFTATGTDTLDNLLPDGTPVTWLVNGAPSQIAQNSAGARQIQTQLVNGTASATLRNPFAAGSLTLTAQVGAASASSAITATTPTASLTSSASTLSIDSGQTATLTLATNAAPGTVVNWFASNGTLSQRSSVVAGGSATTTLLSSQVQGGRPGPVTVFAAIGQKLIGWAGNFVFGGSEPHIKFSEHFLVGQYHATQAQLIAPGMAGKRVRLFVNHAAIVRTEPSALIIGPDGTAHFRVIATVEPELGASAQIHAEIESGNNTGPYISVSTHIDVLNSDVFHAVADCMIGALGGDPQGISGMVGSFVGGLLIIGDAAALLKNAARMVGWQEGEVDQIEVTLVAIGLLATALPADAAPAALKSIWLYLKAILPPEQLGKAGKLMWALIKDMPRALSFAADDRLWRLIKHIVSDGDFVRAVFKTADGSLEKLKAIADCHAVYDDAILHFLERLALNSADEIANAGKCVKCLNDAGPAFKTAVQAAGGSLAKAMDDVAVLIKGGTNAAERIDPGALAKLLENFPPCWQAEATKSLTSWMIRRFCWQAMQTLPACLARMV